MFNDDVRQKLLNGTNNLNKMDNKLIDIEKQGMETADIMRNANTDLRNQRDDIQRIQDRNKAINDNLKQGKKVISQISRKEMQYRLMLYCTILVLFVVDIVLAMVWVRKLFGGNK